MSDPDLPASKQMESWTRDHKLWTHVSEHITECQWPCVCPHPLCDQNLKDATAFQFHLVDEHGLSRTQNGEAAAVAALDSQDDAMANDEPVSNGHPNRKRKKAGSASPLEWMPPQSFPDPTTAPTERLPRRQPKRPRQDASTVCPAALSLEDGTFDKQTTQDSLDSVLLPPASSFGDGESELTLDLTMPGSDMSHTIDSVFDITKTENSDDDSGFDTLFDQYLRSPTTSPPPVDAASELSEPKLIDGDHKQSFCGTDASNSPEDATRHEATCQEPVPGTVFVPRIRLKVREPKITLSFKLPQQGEHGSRPSSKSHHHPNDKERGRHKRSQWGNQNYQRGQKGHRKRR